MLKTILLAACAALLALGSSLIERRGPDQALYCALGEVDGVEVLCPKPRLNGGWPAPFLFDQPGVSVEWKLAFVEDEFRGWPFVADVTFYLLALLGMSGMARTFGGATRRDEVDA